MNVGRTGTINPFAVLEPVEIGGAQVKLATLHNFDLVARKDLRVGDVVQVKRAGEVIPQIIGPVPDKRDPKNPPQPYVPPTHCPSCGTELVTGSEAGDALLPELRVPGAAARGTRPLRVARRDGHSRPLVRAHPAAHRRGARPRRGRPLRSDGGAARRSSSGSPRRAREELVAGDRGVEGAAAVEVAVRARHRARRRDRGQADRPAFRHHGRHRQRHRWTTILAVHGIGETIAESIVAWFSNPRARR